MDWPLQKLLFIPLNPVFSLLVRSMSIFSATEEEKKRCSFLPLDVGYNYCSFNADVASPRECAATRLVCYRMMRDYKFHNTSPADQLRISSSPCKAPLPGNKAGASSKKRKKKGWKTVMNINVSLLGENRGFAPLSFTGNLRRSRRWRGAPAPSQTVSPLLVPAPSAGPRRGSVPIRSDNTSPTPSVGAAPVCSVPSGSSVRLQ